MSRKQKRGSKQGEAQAVTFEKALDRLEEIAQRLETGEPGLEEAIALAEEGLKLSQFCEKQLTEAEGKIEQLVERMGMVEVEPLELASGEEQEED